MGYDRAKRINGYWFRDNGTVDYNRIFPTTPTISSKISGSSSMHLEKKGLDRVIVVDLTREEIGIPVVRVIVPASKSLQWTPNAGESG